MPLRLAAAALLLALTVIVHAVGLMAITRWVLRSHTLERQSFWGAAWLLVRVAWALMVIHVVEIGGWGILYWRNRLLPDIESSVYFSGVTYTSVGYGDLVLPAPWRLLAPVEALTGILMAGLSTAFFFAVLTGLVAARKREGEA